MKEHIEHNNTGEKIDILERAPSGYVKLSDIDLESIVYNLDPEKLRDFSEYISKSYLEQFGIEVEIVFVKEPQANKESAAIIETYLKLKQLQEGFKFEQLRLFKIIKDDDIHDGHYYISYDTKGIRDLDNIYADAIYYEAKNLECEYDVKNPFTGDVVRKNKTNLQSSLRHHLKISGGKNRWEIMVPVKDRGTEKSYLEVFQKPEDVSVENSCRELVKRSGSYVIEQLKIRNKK